jgi:hypothetical protein
VVDTKLDASAWSTVSADYATEDYVIMADNITYNRATGYVDNQQFAKESACQSAFDYLDTNKLDSSAFDLPNSAHWNEATNVVEGNSAAWFDNVGDVEVNNWVYSNSASTEDTTNVVETNSANWNTVVDKLDTTAFTNWQDGQYSTDLQTIEGQINNKLDTSSFSDVSGSFLTAHQSLDGYATEDWVTAQGYITGVDLSPYYTTAEANSLSSMLSGAIDYVSANADNVEVTNVVQSNSGVWNEVTNKLDATAFSNVSGSFYTNDNPSGFITGVDLSNYYTKDETSGKEELAQAFADIPVGDPEVNAYVTNNSASLNGTTDLVQNSSGLWNDVAVYQSNSANYLTAHQDISYKLDTSSFTAWSAAQAENDYQLSAGTGIDLVDDDINKITRIDVTGDFGNPEVESYVQNNSATIDDVNTSYQTNSGTYLTAHQSLEGYAVESAFEYNSNDLITAYNGSAFAGQGGGGEVPTGTMNVSGLEYNAVNGISAYNGSAIAQYGAEKQWLVHDDTLVHASNSAQYALGVNLSAVAQLLGVDETVLYTGNTSATAFTASEPFTNFREVVFYVSPNNTLPAAKVALPIVGYNTSSLALTYHSIWNGFKGGIQISTEYTNTGMSAFQLTSGAWFGWAGTAVNTGTYQDACIYKIVGIGRKS